MGTRYGGGDEDKDKERRMAESIKGEGEIGSSERLPRCRSAQAHISSKALTAVTDHTHTHTPFLSTFILASGHDGFPSGILRLVAIAASIRCRLVRSVARLDQDYVALTHSLIVPPFGLVSFKVCHGSGDSQSL